MDIYYCIVEYLEGNPLYYTGYWKKRRPAFTFDSDHALKLGTREDAEKIIVHLPTKDARIEEHGYMGFRTTR